MLAPGTVTLFKDKVGLSLPSADGYFDFYLAALRLIGKGLGGDEEVLGSPGVIPLLPVTPSHPFRAAIARCEFRCVQWRVGEGGSIWLGFRPPLKGNFSECEEVGWRGICHDGSYGWDAETGMRREWPAGGICGADKVWGLVP